MATGEKGFEEMVLLDKSGTYQEKMDLLLIPRDEIQPPGLTQAPGW